MQKGMKFDQELADLWGWLVGGQVEKKEDYLSHLISPPMLVGIQCLFCQYLLCIAEDYSGSAWQFLNSVKCHLGENSLSYTTVECLPVL
jgi:hypothetical protein